MRFKKNMLLKSNNSKKIVKLISKSGGNNHWRCTQVNGKKAHTIHEGTLIKFYTIIHPKQLSEYL